MKEIIKKWIFEIIFITLSSLLALVAYGIITLPLRSVLLRFEGTPFEKVYLTILSLIMIVVFCLFLILFKKKINNRCEKELRSDYKGGEYVSLIDDFKRSFIGGEYTTLAYVVIINVLSMIFSQTEIFAIWSSMFFMVTVIPYKAVAHIISVIIVLITYYLLLALYRKRIYNKWLKKNNEIRE